MRNKIEKLIIQFSKTFIGVVIMLFAIWICVTVIMFLMYSVFLDNEPLKMLLE